MTQSTTRPASAPRRGVLDEEVRTLARPGAPPSEELPETNPYWAAPPPHPEPERGCIRRGLCCQSSPGWFAPGEVEGAAEFLAMTPDAFAKEFVVIDGWELEGHGWVEVFAPVKLGRDGEPALPPLSRVDELYRYLSGACVFYDGEGCRIYGARPIECRAYSCTNAPEDNLSHEAIARMWAKRAEGA